MKHTQKVTLDISRQSWDTEHNIELVLKFGTGKTVKATLSAEDFALALTGRSELPVTLTTRNVELVAGDVETVYVWQCPACHARYFDQISQCDCMEAGSKDLTLQHFISTGG